MKELYAFPLVPVQNKTQKDSFSNKDNENVFSN